MKTTYIGTCGVDDNHNIFGKIEEIDDFERTDRQFEIEWDEYLKYLKKWSDEHSGVEYYGMTPACFDEWSENEAD